MAKRKNISICAIYTLLSACGGGSGGGGVPFGGAPPVDIGEPTRDSAGNSKSLSGVPMNELVRDGYLMSMSLSNLVLNGFSVFRNNTAVLGTADQSMEVSCRDGGGASLVWKDTDGSGILSTNDQVIVTYAQCDDDGTTINGSAEITVTGPASYDFAADLESGQISYSGRLGFNRGKFDMRVTFGVAGGDIDFAGYQVSIQGLDLAPSIDRDTNAYSYDFRLFVYDKGGNVLTSGVEFSALGEGFVGQLGGFPSSGAMDVLVLWGASLTSGDLQVSPDPAFVNVIVDPNILQKGDEQTTTLSWSEFVR